LLDNDIIQSSKPHWALHLVKDCYEFGLRNAPSIFQWVITEVLRGLDSVIPYLDDVLIASSSEKEHKDHIKLVLDRF
ncbi:hypothetical protein NPIL_54431, partial [Nephila pilipes]